MCQGCGSNNGLAHDNYVERLFLRYRKFQGTAVSNLIWLEFAAAADCISNYARTHWLSNFATKWSA